MRKSLWAVLLLANTAMAQVTITINTDSVKSKISPYIYGKNNSTSDSPNSPTSAATWTFYDEVGITLFRENGGNNATKYNWRKKLSSHPDWYNNVYDHDWDYEAKTIQEKSNAQGMFAFQLQGRVANNKNHNFDDWAYNKSAWWSGTTENLAGGGSVITENPISINAGDADLYTVAWPADSSVAILDHWFDELKIDSSRFRYWNMDNEPEIWSGTHDDVQGSITAEEYIQRYFTVAKKARAQFPGIKLVGPAFTNEWQWYTWNNAKVKDATDGKEYPWVEYFIKRVAEEQKASGVRLLDVLDFHFYAGTTDDVTQTLQLHRVWYDESWDYPSANGLKASGPTGWNDKLTKEYIFKRSEVLLDKYMGQGHGVTLGVSEIGHVHHDDANVVACWYASQLGEFADHGVELFTPWDWYIGQYEVLHLFSKYYGKSAVEALSSNESLVGAYASLSQNEDSLTIVVINRNETSSESISIDLGGFESQYEFATTLQLSGLPAKETFKGKSDNALKEGSVNLESNKITMDVPALSVTFIQVGKSKIAGLVSNESNEIGLFPNPTKGVFHVTPAIEGEYVLRIQNALGKVVYEKECIGQQKINLAGQSTGVYLVTVENKGTKLTGKIFLD